MHPRLRTARLATVVALLPLAACSYTTSDATAPRDPAPTTVAAASDLPTVVVHKSATCTCCAGHEEHLREHGYPVEEVVYDDADELQAMKTELGVPEESRSCHTSVIDGYVVEGHVPVEEIELLLAERPAVDGIALPGMPSGAPGMPGAKVGAWEYHAFTDGESRVDATR